MQVFKFNSSVYQAKFTNDNNWIIASLKSGYAVQCTPFNIHKENFLQDQTDSLVEASFSLDGKQIITANNCGGLKLWDLDTSLLVYDLVGHDDMVMWVVFSFCGR